MGVTTSHGACIKMEEGNVTKLKLRFSREGAKLTVKHPPGPFPVTNGINRETYF